jgi:hypothetical protein
MTFLSANTGLNRWGSGLCPMAKRKECEDRLSFLRSQPAGQYRGIYGLYPPKLPYCDCVKHDGSPESGTDRAGCAWDGAGH